MGVIFLAICYFYDPMAAIFSVHTLLGSTGKLGSSSGTFSEELELYNIPLMQLHPLFPPDYSVIHCLQCGQPLLLAV